MANEPKGRAPEKVHGPQGNSIGPTHRELLLNCFKARKEYSSGVVEGVNNKAKVVMRRSCGFHTFRVLELALYHSLARLPEPALTHEFF